MSADKVRLLQLRADMRVLQASINRTVLARSRLATNPDIVAPDDVDVSGTALVGY